MKTTAMFLLADINPDYFAIENFDFSFHQEAKQSETAI